MYKNEADHQLRNRQVYKRLRKDETSERWKTFNNYLITQADQVIEQEYKYLITSQPRTANNQQIHI